jgi:hypothetical protein
MPAPSTRPTMRDGGVSGANPRGGDQGDRRLHQPHGARQIMADLRDIAKAHAGKALIAAVAVGFLAARELRAD